MTTYLLANWKSNKTLGESVLWLETFLATYESKPNLKIIIAPPAHYLAPLHAILSKHGAKQISLAAQDISPFPTGSYTGAIAADILKDFVDFAIIGHSERRRYFHESHSEIGSKASEAQAAGITPILCVDMDYVRAQIGALDQEILDAGLLIGYGPVSAIDMETPPLPENTQECITKIQHMVPNQAILYGGSIQSHNAQSYQDLTGISGLMVGSACLDAEEFAKIHAIIGNAAPII
jgi:triosephosphate isomerase